MSMTREEAILLSAYTGYLLVSDFAEVHKFCEETLGHPIWTHEFADRGVQKEIQAKLRPKILEMVQNISAVRPVSQEQVKRSWPGCDYCKHTRMEGLDLKPCASGNAGVELSIGRCSEDDAFGMIAYYRNAAAGYIDFSFCPFCGAPMTAEAVDILLRRLETLKDETD